ncbi:hypothetical protein U1Q18_052363 [Sarracenia purpurea var. burkii]
MGVVGNNLGFEEETNISASKVFDESDLICLQSDLDPVRNNGPRTCDESKNEGFEAGQVVYKARMPSSSKTWANIVATSGKKNDHKVFNESSKLKACFPRFNIRSGSHLEYIASKIPGIIDIDDEMIDEQSWDTCLVGYFLLFTCSYLLADN